MTRPVAGCTGIFRFSLIHPLLCVCHSFHSSSSPSPFISFCYISTTYTQQDPSIRRTIHPSTYILEASLTLTVLSLLLLTLVALYSSYTSPSSSLVLRWTAASIRTPSWSALRPWMFIGYIPSRRTSNSLFVCSYIASDCVVKIQVRFPPRSRVRFWASPLSSFTLATSDLPHLLDHL